MMSPLGDAVCYVAALGLWALSTLLLARTHSIEVSKRTGWGWLTGLMALLAAVMPMADTATDITAILALAVCSAGWAAFAWGRSPSAPSCVQAVAGWHELVTQQHDEELASFLEFDTRAWSDSTQPWSGK